MFFSTIGEENTEGKGYNQRPFCIGICVPISNAFSLSPLSPAQNMKNILKFYNSSGMNSPNPDINYLKYGISLISNWVSGTKSEIWSSTVSSKQ